MKVLKKVPILGPLLRRFYRGQVTNQNFVKLSEAGVTKSAKDAGLPARKKSDTLFIMGGGASIALYSEAQLAEIRAHDSVGFNFWLIHDLVPTFYFFEAPFDSGRAELLVELMNVRAADYAGVPMVMKGTSRKSPHFDFFADTLKKVASALKPHMFLARDHHVKSPTVEELRESLRQLEASGAFTAGADGIETIPQVRASVSYLMAFAFMLGYKKIVLCGIDLNDTRYFYEVDKDYYASKGRNIPGVVHTGKVHSTLTAQDGLPVDKVIYAMRDEIVKPRGIELFVGAGTSALHPELPVYPWQEEAAAGR